MSAFATNLHISLGRHSTLSNSFTSVKSRDAPEVIGIITCVNISLCFMS